MINTYIPYLKSNEKKKLLNCIKANFVSTSNLFKLLYGMRKWLAKELKADENVNIIMTFIFKSTILDN